MPPLFKFTLFCPKTTHLKQKTVAIVVRRRNEKWIGLRKKERKKEIMMSGEGWEKGSHHLICKPNY